MSWTGVITNAGQALLDQWAAGGHTLTIDRAAVGSGLTAAADMLTATNLANQQAAASIISNEAVAGGTKFKILISPAETAAYTATELGIWAHIDSNASVLMSLHQDEAGGIAIPTRTQSPDFAFAMYIIHAINNTDLTVNIDPNAYVPNSVFSEAISTLESTKLAKTGDAQNTTVTFESDDEADSEVTRETAWTTVAKLTSSETLKSMFKKISGMFKNVRRHEKVIGSVSDIATLSNAGTISGALNKLNTDLIPNPISFTPHLYDVDTKVRELTGAGAYWKVGKFCFGRIMGNSLDLSGVSTMMQFRNMPCYTLGGTVYISGLSGEGGNKTIQASGYLYPRPNIKSSDIANPSAPGVVVISFYGYFE